MRIAFLTDGIYPYVIGGMQKHSFYLVKFLASKGITVDLYHFSQSKVLNPQSLDVFTESEKKFINNIVVEFPEPDKFPGHYLRESFKYSEKIYEIFKTRPDVDFIYAKGFSAWKFLKEKAKGEKFPPVGVNFHGLEMFQKSAGLKSSLESLMLRGPVKENLKSADFLFSYGGKVTEILKGCGMHESKIIEIPTGIQASWINDHALHTNKTVKFVFVGRYERRKGIEELNKVLKEIIDLPELHFEFNFIGPIPESKKIYDKKIKYWGIINDAEAVKKIISVCDVLVCPSYSEGMPNVIMEGMASGLAIIATDVGAVSEQVSSKNGWLIDELSVDKLKATIFEAIRINADLLLQKKQASVELVKNKFLWENIIDKTISEIRKAISKTS